MEEEFGDNDNKDFENEKGSWDRAAVGSKLAELLESSSVLDKGKKRELISQRDRTLTSMNAFCQEMRESGHIQAADIDIILEKAVSLPHTEFLNPTAFVLGFIGTNGGQSMNKKEIMGIFEKILPSLDSEKGVTNADIIRYSRLWVNS